MLINVKMPKIVGILTFMSRINFVLSWVEYEKSFITSGQKWYSNLKWAAVLSRQNRKSCLLKIWVKLRFFLGSIRPNKKRPVFKVTRPYLNLLVKPRFFRFSGKNIILCILKGEMPFKMHKIIFFSRTLIFFIGLISSNLSNDLFVCLIWFFKSHQQSFS